MTQTTKLETSPTSPIILSAKELRASIFSNVKKPMRRPYTFNGVEVELLQPVVSAMFNASNTDENTPNKNFIVRTMIDCTVVPGTNDRVFEDTDYDSIMDLPMSGDISNVSKIITEMFDINVKVEVGN